MVVMVAYEGYCKIFRIGIVEVTSSILFLNVSKFWSAISILENIIFRYTLKIMEMSFYGNCAWMMLMDREE